MKRIFMKRIKHIIENGVEKKWCGKCKQWLPLTFFSKNVVKWNQLQERCNDCRKQHWHTIGKYTKKELPLEIKRKRSRQQLIKSYGMTEIEFNDMLAKQNYCCAICGTTNWGHISPSIDHNHKTGQVRGLLCNRCNRILGLANDSPELLNKMYNYLKQYEETNR